MTVNTNSETTNISERVGDTNKLADAEAIDGDGVEQGVGNVASFSVFLDVEGAVEVTVEFSPDGGSTWYEPRDESPVSFGGANTDLVHVDYNATRVRLTGSNGTAVTAQVREVV